MAAGAGAGGAKPSLTQQEMQAAALAAAEHGYDDREYYVDDGENYYGEEYGEPDYGQEASAVGSGGYIGAEGRLDRVSFVYAGWLVGQSAMFERWLLIDATFACLLD